MERSGAEDDSVGTGGGVEIAGDDLGEQRRGVNLKPDLLACQMAGVTPLLGVCLRFALEAQILAADQYPADRVRR